MSNPRARKIFHCVVDDTALITNISEIKNWVSHGAITLIIPLYTLDRLHLLKKDTSQIGINAREATKFLDRVTSGKDGLSMDSITIQGPDQQYATWAQVEEHVVQDGPETENGDQAVVQESKNPDGTVTAAVAASPESAGGALSQVLLNKLNFAKEPGIVSTTSTPPASSSSSSPQSSKASPEVTAAKLQEHDASNVPPVLKALINSIIWYSYEYCTSSKASEILFLTNAVDTANLTRKFGISPKNIHQLRTAIGLEDQEIKNQSKYLQKHPSPPPAAAAELEPRPLFKYEDSDEEEVVFKPRGRGSKGSASLKASPATSVRSKNGTPRSPVLALSTPNRTAQKKLEIPTEEIDPDSFDRGSFARGTVPLADTGPQSDVHVHTFPRNAVNRGAFSSAGLSRGNFSRGASRGFDRGSGRGRGRLFVP